MVGGLNIYNRKQYRNGIRAQDLRKLQPQPAKAEAVILAAFERVRGEMCNCCTWLFLYLPVIETLIQFGLIFLSVFLACVLLLPSVSVFFGTSAADVPYVISIHKSPTTAPVVLRTNQI